MKIETVEIKYYFYNSFSMDSNDDMVHKKSLPHLSIVQSKVGSYGIKLNDGREYSTGMGNFFVAPSVDAQKITHYLDDDTGIFEARYIFLDIIINQKYRFDDIFDIPVVIDGDSAKLFNDDFNEYDSTQCACDKMRCLYNIVKHLIKISSPKNVFRNSSVYPLTDFIKSNYADDIDVGKMADILNMSESNLYSVFRRATGMSPIKYLNEYRLSVAAILLLQTDDSVKTIAEKVGIDDSFYFSKLFKRKYLISPRQYRAERY